MILHLCVNWEERKVFGPVQRPAGYRITHLWKILPLPVYPFLQHDRGILGRTDLNPCMW